MFYYSGLSTIRIVFSQHFFFLWNTIYIVSLLGLSFAWSLEVLFCIIFLTAFFYRVNHQTTIILLDVLAKWLWYEIPYNLKNVALKKYQPTSAMGLECPNFRYVQISDENRMLSLSNGLSQILHRYCLLGLFLVEDEAAVSGINNMRATYM